MEVQEDWEMLQISNHAHPELIQIKKVLREKSDIPDFNLVKTLVCKKALKCKTMYEDLKVPSVHVCGRNYHVSQSRGSLCNRSQIAEVHYFRQNVTVS